MYGLCGKIQCNDVMKNCITEVLNMFLKQLKENFKENENVEETQADSRKEEISFVRYKITKSDEDR